MADNLFEKMFEAPGDPPAPLDDSADPAAAAPTPTEQSQPADGGGGGGDGSSGGGDLGGGAPPDMGDMSAPEMGGDEMGAEGDGQQGQGEEEDDVPLDEKGEIFAKVNIFKSFRQLYQKVQDTIDTIDKIDLVQVGNNIKSDDVGDVKSRMSELMEDIYVTIVYEFQLAYGNLKVKLVEYSSRYVLLTNALTRLIKKDQRTSES